MCVGVCVSVRVIRLTDLIACYVLFKRLQSLLKSVVGCGECVFVLFILEMVEIRKLIKGESTF